MDISPELLLRGELTRMKVPELKARAKAGGLANYSYLRKQELIDLLVRWERKGTEGETMPTGSESTVGSASSGGSGPAYGRGGMGIIGNASSGGSGPAYGGMGIVGNASSGGSGPAYGGMGIVGNASSGGSGPAYGGGGGMGIVGNASSGGSGPAYGGGMGIVGNASSGGSGPAYGGGMGIVGNASSGGSGPAYGGGGGMGIVGNASSGGSGPAYGGGGMGIVGNASSGGNSCEQPTMAETSGSDDSEGFDAEQIREAMRQSLAERRRSLARPIVTTSHSSSSSSSPVEVVELLDASSPASSSVGMQSETPSEEEEEAEVEEPQAKKAKTEMKICPIFIKAALGVVKKRVPDSSSCTDDGDISECPLCEGEGIYRVHGTGQEQSCRMCESTEESPFDDRRETSAPACGVMVNIKQEKDASPMRRLPERLDLRDFSREHLGELACLVRDKGFNIIKAAEAMRNNDYKLYESIMELTKAKEDAEENLARNQAAEESLATRDVEKKMRSKSEKEAFLEGGLEFLETSEQLAGADLWDHLEAVVDFLLDNRDARVALYAYLQERTRAIRWYKVPAQTYFVANMPLVSSIEEFLSSIGKETNKVKEAMYDLPKCGGATPLIFRQFEDARPMVETDEVAVVEAGPDCHIDVVELDDDES